MTDPEAGATKERKLATAETQAELEAAAERALPRSPRARTSRRRDGREEVGARDVRADVVEIRQAGAGRVEAAEVDVRQGGIGLARADRVDVRLGAVGVALGREVGLRQAVSRLAAARGTVRMEQAGAMAVVANRVELGPRSGVVFLFARRVEGGVRPVFDWRAGLAFGAAAGLVAALTRLVGGRRRR